MGNNITKKILMDGSTGEILKENTFFTYDGFNDKGYKYRYRGNYIRYYFDAVPTTLSEEAFLLLIMLTELANEDNVLVYRVTRKSKFSNIIYKPMCKEDIMAKLKYKYGQNKFDRCWKELKKHCIKKIRYHEYLAWAINPSIFCKCKQIPPWLYEEFSLYLNPYMSKTAIKKMNDLLK